MGLPAYLSPSQMDELLERLPARDRALFQWTKTAVRQLMDSIRDADDVREATARAVPAYWKLSLGLLGPLLRAGVDLGREQGLRNLERIHREVVRRLGEGTWEGDAADYGYRVLERLMVASLEKLGDPTARLLAAAGAGDGAEGEPSALALDALNVDLSPGTGDFLSFQLMLAAMALDELAEAGTPAQLKRFAEFMGDVAYQARARLPGLPIDPFDDLAPAERNARLLRGLTLFGEQAAAHGYELPEF